jgi:hypothetical protein
MVTVASDAYRHWPLEPWQRQQLATAISQCQSLKQANAIAQLYNELPTAIRRNAVQAPTTLLASLSNIIDQCASYASGMETLVDTIEFYNRGTRELDHVFEILECIGYRSVSLEKVIALRLILEEINFSEDRCIGWCRESIPSGAPLPRIHPARGTLRSVLDWLAGAGRMPDGAVPIVRFARLVAEFARDPERSIRISRWADVIAHNLEIDEAATAQLRPGAAPLCDPLYLLVELEPKSAGSGYIVQAWLAKGADIDLRYSTSDAVALESMPVRFKEILQTIKSDLIQAQNDLRIEFVVPYDLLCHPVETWPNLLDDPIGIIYPVVVRARWRIRQDDYWPQWSKRWHCYPHGRTLLCTKLQADARQKLHKDLLDDGVLCLALPFLPEINLDARDDIVHAAVRFGIPIAIWLKSEPDNASASETKLKKLLEGSLEDLPKRILCMRRLGDRLTLLWDDYTRMPDCYPDLEAAALL